MLNGLCLRPLLTESRKKPQSFHLCPVWEMKAVIREQISLMGFVQSVTQHSAYVRNRKEDGVGETRRKKVTEGGKKTPKMRTQ